MNAPTAYRIRAGAAEDLPRAAQAAGLIRAALRERVIGLAERTEADLAAKIRDGLAVLALAPDDALAGFILVCPWEDTRWVSTSGLVVAPEHRRHGLAARLKEEAFRIARDRFPRARLFGLTTSGAIMKVNARTGWTPVPYAEVCRDPGFWKGCEACPHHETLKKMQGEICFCTAMRYDPPTA